MGVEDSAQRRNQEGGPGCWNCVFCVLVYGLDAGLRGDEVMYSKEQRRCKLCSIRSARALTATSLPLTPKAEAPCVSWLPLPFFTTPNCAESHPEQGWAVAGTLPSSWHFCFVRQALTKLTNETLPPGFSGYFRNYSGYWDLPRVYSQIFICLLL